MSPVRAWGFAGFLAGALLGWRTPHRDELPPAVADLVVALADPKPAGLVDVVRRTHDLRGILANAGMPVEDWNAQDRGRVEAALAHWIAAGYAAWVREFGPPGIADPRAEPPQSPSGTPWELAAACTSQGGDAELRISLVGLLPEARICGWTLGETHGLDLLRAELTPPRSIGDPELIASTLEVAAELLGQPPEGTVERLHTALLAAMRSRSEYRERYRALAPVVLATHDFDAIGRLALRSSWDGLSPEERERFLRIFRRLGVSTYAARFHTDSGERFETTGTKELRSGFVVHSVLVTGKGERKAFDYLMRRSGGRWRIVNIVVDGVSDLALKRAEYSAIIDRDGFEELLEELEEQVRGHEAGTED